MVGHHRLGLGLARRAVFRIGLLGRVQLLLNRRNLAVQDLRRLGQVALTGELVSLDALGVQLGAQVADLVVAGLLRIPAGLEAAQLLASVRELVLQLLQALLAGRILGLLELHLLHLVARDLALQLVDLLRGGVELHAQVRCRLIDQIDGLVGQLTAGNIAVRERRGGDQRVVADRHLVVRLVTLLQATQNRDRVLHARLAHEHLLETTLKRRVLLDVLAVLVQRGRADQAKLAARQHGLEHVAGIHRAFGRASADDRMNLVDERDDLAVGVLDFVEHALEALLELATILRAGNHRPQIEADELLVLQRGRHIAGHDTLGEALHDGGLADAGLADQHRVVLGAAAQDLDHTADLLITPDHRVELTLLGAGGQIGGVLLQRLVAALSVRAGDLGTAAHAGDGLAQRRGRHAVRLEDVRALVRRGCGDADEQVLGGDVLVAHLPHLLLGLCQRRRQLAARLRLRCGGPTRRRHLDQSIAHRGANRLRVAARRLNQSLNHAVFLTQQRIHHVQCLDLRVARGRRALNRITDDFLGHGGELLFHINLRMSHAPWRPRPTTSEPPRTALSVCV